LIELGQRRRRQGRPANIKHFISPLVDGLIFGEMQRLDMDADMANSIAPELMDCRNGLALRHQLVDFFRKRDKRLFITVRTFVDQDRLQSTQNRLKETLNRYVRRHTAVIECLRYRSRLAFDADPPYGPIHHDLFAVPRPSRSDYQNALAELDSITSSEEWVKEVTRSAENKSRKNRQAL
jgi:hypothetical protein